MLISTAVVPCCVFPKMFPRKLPLASASISSAPASDVEISVSVQSHPQFVDYLLSKDPRIRMDRLDFEGRNVVIFMLPPEK